jgi:L-threonylcarbamoyladenylate synthase
MVLFLPESNSLCGMGTPAYLCNMAEKGRDILRAKKLLLEGTLVAIPTETVYGLAANALNEQAVLSVFTAKNRPFFDPLIIHVPSLEAAQEYADFSDERLLHLARHFWPGPLTLLLPKKNNIPDIVTSGLPRVAIRVPAHPLTLELLQSLTIPLAAPSANPFGYVSPTTADHVNKQLGTKVGYILDGGPCTIGLESTIVGIEENQLVIYRLGGLATEAIEAIAGEVELRLNISSDPTAPGQLKNHYAPRKPLFMGSAEELLQVHKGKKIALIAFQEPTIHHPLTEVFSLSLKGDLNEAAVNLFKVLREADDSDAEVVIAEFVPEEGLGKAINDRLRRAAAR